MLKLKQLYYQQDKIKMNEQELDVIYQQSLNDLTDDWGVAHTNMQNDESDSDDIYPTDYLLDKIMDHYKLEENKTEEECSDIRDYLFECIDAGLT
jgi:hypothetical protein